MIPWLAGKRFRGSVRAAKLLRSVATAKGLRMCGGKHLKQMERPCIIALHPHGRYPMNLFPWFAKHFDVFDKVSVAQSSLGKFVPTVGYVTMCCQVIDVARHAIIRELAQKGRHVALFPGGAREMVHANKSPNNAIVLVRHSGFLRLAHAFDGSRPAVIPCFLFDERDAYFNPLAHADAILFKATGVNIPCWWPSPQSAKTANNVMVLGGGVSPEDYETLDEFCTAYFTALEDLFEFHKKKIPRYANLNIEWIETPRS